MSSVQDRNKKDSSRERESCPPLKAKLFLLAVVIDAVDGADKIVGHEQRSIPILLHVDRTAEIVAVVIPAFSKRNRGPGDRAVILEESDHEARADRHGSVPRAVLGREDRPLVLRRELVAGVEGEAEVGRMSDLLDFGEDQVGRRRVGLEFVGAGVSAAVPWESKLLAGLVDAVHLAGRDIVAHAVNLVVVAPKRLVLRVEVQALWIAQTCRIDLAVLAVLIHADD